MPILDQVSHSAAVAKWKINQQKQIFQTQNEINDLNNKINTQKLILGEQAYRLFVEGSISNDPLFPICERIMELDKQKKNCEQELDFIKSQAPPPQVTPVYSSNYDSPPVGKLVCPKCGGIVETCFCTNCGVEGVPSDITD